MQTHLELLSGVLKLLKEAGLELNMKKCKFALNEIDYLGYKINEGGIKPNDAHIEAIRAYPMPRNVKDVQRCNGLFPYFRRFVPNYSSIAKPITNLLRKESKFVWTDECTAQRSCRSKTMVNAIPWPIFQRRPLKMNQNY